MPIPAQPAIVDRQQFEQSIQRAIAQQLGAQAQQAQPASSNKEGLSTLAKLVYGVGAGADLATTAYGTAKGVVHENNPLIRWAGPKAQLPVGAAMELGGVLLAN